MVNKASGQNHPNAKLTDEDVEQTRQLIEWKKEEIARINSIASCAALAEKFEVSKNTIERIGSYNARRGTPVSYEAKTEQTKKNISAAKISKDRNAAGDYKRRTGIDAIDIIRQMAPTHTKTEVAAVFGWSNATSMTSWMKVRGYEVDFKKHKPVPPKNRAFGSIDFGKRHEPKHHADQRTL